MQSSSRKSEILLALSVKMSSVRATELLQLEKGSEGDAFLPLITTGTRESSSIQQERGLQRAHRKSLLLGR